jgi:hypothetical protein
LPFADEVPPLTSCNVVPPIDAVPFALRVIFCDVFVTFADASKRPEPETMRTVRFFAPFIVAVTV